MAKIRGQALVTNLRGVLVVTPWVAYLGAADVALSLLLPVKLFAPNLVYNLSSYIALPAACARSELTAGGANILGSSTIFATRQALQPNAPIASGEE